ncbi:MAG TPA: phosphate ABC transporter permease subunit PstC [Bacteroidales bacterium]|nr:phosphate ABC transporter permease subunit PstC [Bacteroidales bacterium]
MAVPKKQERVIESILKGSAWFTILITIGIIWVLLYETVIFFRHVSLIEFFTATEWTPLFSIKKYGILPLLTATFLTSFIAIAVALPLGLTIAIYLSEYANPAFRRTVKPVLELLASIPTVVYGFFALTTITPFLQSFIPGMAGFNALSPGIVMGIMIMPLITSLSEDALYAIPGSMRFASYALGASRFQTTFRVLLPAASSGIGVSVILAISRAIGETMIVAIAAGQQPRLTLNPLVPVETITTYIVQVSMGDVPQNSPEFRSIFAAGMVLFLFTFGINNLGLYLKRKFYRKYEL